jgi:hypothetical protein
MHLCIFSEEQWGGGGGLFLTFSQYLSFGKTKKTLFEEECLMMKNKLMSAVLFICDLLVSGT